MRAWIKYFVSFAGLSGTAACSYADLCANDYCAAPDASVDGSSDGGPDATGKNDAAIDAMSGGDTGADVTMAPDAPSDAPVDSWVCPTTADPKDQPCVLDESLGVFVAPAPAGSDAAGCGTRAKPCATIGHAMDVAKGGSRRRVYACGGSYNEHLVVGASQDGLTAYGTLSCAGGTWAYDGSAVATVAPSSSGYALEVTGLTTGATFKGFAFQVGNANGAGASSIAAFVHGASGVVFAGCTFTTGLGAQGQDQTPPAPFASAAPTGAGGTLLGGGTTMPNPACTMSVGGAGGAPGATTGNDGTDGSPGPSNKGLATACKNNGTPGGFGASGNGGNAGPGAAAWASFDATGWMPAAGQSGGPGTLGQGGGGGGSADSTGGGGGGGAGGCGGGGGGGGSGGGSSIALLVFGASVDVEQCTVTTAAAGRGGNGAAGQAGQTGGTRGPAYASSNACNGGKGGNGGDGGGGGGGAGGLSAGIVWSGTAPTINGASTPSATSVSGFTSGSPGAAGNGATAAQNGKAGTSAAVVPFQ